MENDADLFGAEGISSQDKYKVIVDSFRIGGFSPSIISITTDSLIKPGIRNVSISFVDDKDSNTILGSLKKKAAPGLFLQLMAAMGIFNNVTKSKLL